MVTILFLASQAASLWAKKPNVLFIMADDLGWMDLACQGNPLVETPNLDRFAATRATRFTNHVTGSLPCMPARHDILCGALDFLWKPWGSIELWEAPITRVLGQAGVTSHLATDHPHLFETGGENYHTDFDGWEYVRGHEGDLWRTHPDPTWAGTPALPARRGGWFYRKQFGVEGLHRGYDESRTFFRTEEDWPGPRTMIDATRFLTEAAPHHDRWFLFVDEFDPHEPFDTPAPWAGRYFDEPWDEEWIIWPPYIDGGIASGAIDEREARHVRANYGAKLTMIDHWFGHILDAFDRDIAAELAFSIGQALERVLTLQQLMRQRAVLETLTCQTEAQLRSIVGSGELTDVAMSQLAVQPDLGHEPATTEDRAAHSLRLVRNLTRRELEVLQLMSTGATNADIAAHLVLAEGTVKTHVKRILRKLNVGNRGQAVAHYTNAMRNRGHL